MERCLTIRLTKKTGITDAKVKQFVKAYEYYIVAYESADEEVNSNHYHILISSAKERETIRKDFKKAFPEVKNNTDFAISPSKRTDKKEWETDPDNIGKMKRYHCKGKELGHIQGIIAWKGITPEEIKSLNSQYWELNKEIQQLKKKYIRTTNKNNVSVGKRLIRFLTEHSSSFLSNNILHQRRLKEMIVHFFRRSIQGQDKFIIERFYNLAFSHFSPRGYMYEVLAGTVYYNIDYKTGKIISKVSDDLTEELDELDEVLGVPHEVFNVEDYTWSIEEKMLLKSIEEQDDIQV